MGGSTPDIATISSPSRPSERIQTVNYRFDIIGLLSKAQQALVLFSTLFQSLSSDQRDDTLSSVSVQSSDAINELLFELLFSKISSIHDREIKLSESDCVAFIYQVNQRNESSNSFLGKHISDHQSCASGPRLRCFIKKLNTNSVMITLIPSTFNDLKSLVYNRELNPNSVESLKAFHEIDDNTSDNSLYGCLSLPIFIYKTSFNALSDQLVFLSEGKQWKDLYLDNTYKSEKCQSCNHPFKLFKANESESETVSKSSIRQFCRTLQLIYWNCMTQALYRSLQLGYSVDKRDILKIVENISDKFVLTLDISRFLIYLCEHLKQYLIKSYTNERHFDVNKLIENNFQNAITFTLTDLIRSAKSCSDIRDLHLDIKEKFQAALEHYLCPIPSFPSFYFFNCKASTTIDNSFSDSNLMDKSLVNSTNDELPKNSAISSIIGTETKANANKSDDSYSLSTLKSCPKNELSEENISLSKSNSSKVSCTALDLTSEDLASLPNLCLTSKTATLDSDTYLDHSSQPLFLRLSCSIQTQFGIKECFPTSLPTCFRDVVDLLDGQPSG